MTELLALFLYYRKVWHARGLSETDVLQVCDMFLHANRTNYAKLFVVRKPFVDDTMFLKRLESAGIAKHTGQVWGLGDVSFMDGDDAGVVDDVQPYFKETLKNAGHPTRLTFD